MQNILEVASDFDRLASMAAKLRGAILAGDAEAVAEWRDEIEVVQLHSRSAAVRHKARVVLTALQVI